ncbi:MAG TPA: serine hydrolase domain-containing protein, partial [Candidatus Elarobacter sp.]
MSAILPDAGIPSGLPRATAPEEVGFAADRLERLVARFRRDVDAGEIPGAVIFVARHGKVACLTALGYRDRDLDAAMPIDAVFRGASITKPITVAVALSLVDDGLLQLAEPLAKYFPAFANVQVGVEELDERSEPR